MVTEFKLEWQKSKSTELFFVFVFHCVGLQYTGFFFTFHALKTWSIYRG